MLSFMVVEDDSEHGQRADQYDSQKYNEPFTALRRAILVLVLIRHHAHFHDRARRDDLARAVVGSGHQKIAAFSPNDRRSRTRVLDVT